MDKVVNVIRSDGDFKGGVITMAGTCVTLAPYIALGFNCPVPYDVVWAIKMAGFLMLAAGVAISYTYMFYVIRNKQTLGAGTKVALTNAADESGKQEKG